jgi:hypothetical protein
MKMFPLYVIWVILVWRGDLMKRNIKVYILDKKVYFALLFLVIVTISSMACLHKYKNNRIDEKIKNAISKIEDSYSIDIDSFNIENNGTSPIETSKGINAAFKYAIDKGYRRISFPEGIYLIDENNPIIIDFKNVIIDLNGSTLQINTNGLDKYSIVEFRDGAEKILFTNGIISGDEKEHDYKTIESSHEWGFGINFVGGYDCEVSNITVSNVTGYGINVESGNNYNRLNNIDSSNLTSGSYSNIGNRIEDDKSIRTIEPYDISMCEETFELGYTTGYQGFPYIENREFFSYFYDSNMRFIKKVDCLQFRKADIPLETKFVHFSFPQENIKESINCAWISNFKPPTNITIRECIIKENRTLGMGFCGGQKWLVENNIFEANGGNSPGYDIDFEDGWELMQDITIKNNKFIDGTKSIVVCAGDNIVIKENQIHGMVNFNSRVTNYKVLYNKFNNCGVNLKYSTDTTIKGNQYNGGAVWIEFEGELRNNASIEVSNETYVDTNPSSVKVKEILNSTIIWNKGFSGNLSGVYKNCDISLSDGYMVDSELYDCSVKDSNLVLQKNNLMERCTIKSSTFDTYNNIDTILLKECNINGSKFYNSYYWDKLANFEIWNCNIIIDNKDDSFLDLALGRIDNLVFRSNTITNSGSVPVINFYDTYSGTLNGKIIIEENKFEQNNSPYIISGMEISSGDIEFNDYNNIIKGGLMLNPIYKNNKNFIIHR